MYAMDIRSVLSVENTDTINSPTTTTPNTHPHPYRQGRIYASVNRITFGSDNGMSPARRQAII